MRFRAVLNQTHAWLCSLAARLTSMLLLTLLDISSKLLRLLFELAH
jgi:hypothetical protein